MDSKRLSDCLMRGVQAGWKLLGCPVDICLTDEGLGYTHPAGYGDPVRIYINPRVLEESRGAELFDALVLHELGHHAYHFSDPDFKKVSLRLRHARLKSLFNLILDEHMERRLRSRNPAWGEALDALMAFILNESDAELFMDDYARMMGLPDREAAIEAVVQGRAPGEIKLKEQGYRLKGQGDRWISFVEFLQMLTERLGAWFDSGRLPEHIDEDFAWLRKAALGQLCPTEDGLLQELRQMSLFDEYSPEAHESVARISLLDLIDDVPDEVDSAREYVVWLTKTLAPYLRHFPKLQRFIDEMERSQNSEWFECKRNAMLHNMRRKRDFHHAFTMDALTTREVRKLLGKSLFNPSLILQELLTETRPEPAPHPERPAFMHVPWNDMLAAPGTPSMSRFFLSLQLGLGRRFVGDDKRAEAALQAVPRGLRKLRVEALGVVTEKVAEILGEQALDDDRSEQAGGCESGAGGFSSGSSIGQLLRSKTRERIDPFRRPCEEDQLSEQEQSAMQQAARDAARRIDHWLRTGVDPDEGKLDRKQRNSLPRGARSVGMDRMYSPPGGCRDHEEQPGAVRRDLLNLAETLEFDRISRVEKPPDDRAAYNALALQVRPQVRLLRHYLVQLGQAEVEQSAHRMGRRLDPARLRRLAVFNQPDVMMGLETRLAPDLFLGICIDCSGSMSCEDRMDKAQRFAALLLEACRGLPGIDCHALGFTDDEILDVGGPGSTRLASLEPGGGNNDAAGLLALAQHAMDSGKDKRLLVMISDGYPTECSLNALAGLVRALEGRFRMRCVQVAVDEMDEERLAFPRFTDLTRHDTRMAVKLFGRMIGKTLQHEFF